MTNLIHTIEEVPKDKKLIVFDLDGTLTESKVQIDTGTVELLGNLLKIKKVGIVSGGEIERFKFQILDHLPHDALLENLLLMPLNGGTFYEYHDSAWHQVYAAKLSDVEKTSVREAFEHVFKEVHYVAPEKLYGEQIEDRGSQITFSFLGQEAPLEEKTRWSQEHNAERLAMALKLQDYLPNMEVKTAGLTSIDITRRGINKKFAVEKLMEHTTISVADTLFVGDALEPNGNDTPALEAGILCLKVDSPADTKRLIEYLLG